MAEEVHPSTLEGLEVPEGALITGAFRLVFCLEPDGTEAAYWTHDGRIILGRLLGEFEVIKFAYISGEMDL